MIVVVNTQKHISSKLDFDLRRHHFLTNPYTHLHFKGNVSKYNVKSLEEALNAFRRPYYGYIKFTI